MYMSDIRWAIRSVIVTGDILGPRSKQDVSRTDVSFKTYSCSVRIFFVVI